MRKAGIAVAALGAVLAYGSAANAAVVAQLGATAGYTALPGEKNDVVVTRDGSDAVFEDRGNGPFVVGPGCRSSGTRIARCSGALTLHFTLDDGNDRVIARTALHVAVDGGSGDDRITTGPAADELHGGPGDDVLNGGENSDLLDGGDGVDSADYGERQVRVIVVLDLLPNDGERGEGDRVTATENVAGGAGGDILVGDDHANVLYGGPGDDALAGRGGKDTLVGGPGSDGINAGDPPASSASSGSGAPDSVDCGDGRDRVFGDTQDSVRADCESVDRSGVLGYSATSGAGADPPVLGRSVVVRPISGAILVVPQTSGDPNAAQPVPASPPMPLDDERNIPIGSVIDTRFGTVEMTTAVDSAGTTQVGQFHSGPFQIFQRAVDGATADLALRGGKSFAICGRQNGPGLRVFSARKAKKRRGKLIRRLWSDAHGRFRTGGRFASATVRGTRWLTEDRCEGTLVRVARGSVVVHDAALDRDVTVDAGERYLARTP